MNRGTTADEFPYYRCLDCGLVSLRPVPPNLSRFYPSNYHDIPRSPHELVLRQGREGYKLDVLSGLAGKRLLEIGPSFGAFASLAKQAGFEVHAIEMDLACFRFITEMAGVIVEHTSHVVAALARQGQYDAITMWHSLEHLANPWEVLDELPRHLVPGGRLVIATPNPESLQFRLFGARWVHLDAPRHINLVPPGVLEARLARAGMRRIDFTTADRGARECNLLGWIASPRTRMPRWERSRLVSAAWKMTIPISRLVEGGRHGAAYTMAFVKDGLG